MTTCAAASAACGPGAKINLAYATGPFSVPNCPARPSRTTEGLILYGAMGGGRRHSTAPGSLLKSAAARCEPIPAFPLLPGPSTHPAWPSPASVAARCEPFSPNRLTPASRDSGSGPDTMAAGARKQAASCDAFVLSGRLPAPDAPPSRTSPACLVAKPFPEPARPPPSPRKKSSATTEENPRRPERPSATPKNRHHPPKKPPPPPKNREKPRKYG